MLSLSPHGAGARPKGPRSRFRFRLHRSIVWIVGALMLLSLYGCATVRPEVHQAPAPTTHTAAASHRQAPMRLDVALLSARMSIREVSRLEPPPNAVFRMSSPTVTVEKWVYEYHGRQTDLYFVNGFLATWGR